MEAGLAYRLDEHGFPVKEAHPNVFEIYSREAKIYDTAMVERWKTAMEGLLIFAGLFSAVVTAFIIESYKLLQPDNEDITVRLLYQISQQIAAANGAQVSVPSFLLPEPSDFSPPYTAMTANILWFFSLGLSLACAVSATLVQQWARNYIHAIERRPSAERRARMRMFLFEGVGKFKLSSLIDTVPALLHLALLTFLLGLVFFIWPINTTVSAIACAIFSVCVAAYLFATFLPLLAFDSPIQTPLTSLVWNKTTLQIVYWSRVRLAVARDMIVLAFKSLIYPISIVWGMVDLVARTAFSVFKSNRLVSPMNMIWSLLDLVARTSSSSFFRKNVLAPLTMVWNAFDLLVRTIFPNPTPLLHRASFTFQMLRSDHEARITISIANKAESKDLDSFRSFVAKDSRTTGFDQREHRALAWLLECLDDDREFLPFIEAIPAFIRAQADSDPSVQFKTYESLSSILRHNQLGIPLRLHDLLHRHYTNRRVVSSYIDFLPCTRKADWRYIFQSKLATFSSITYPSNHPIWDALPADSRLKLRCLDAQMYSCWLTVAPEPNQLREVQPFAANPQWSSPFTLMWHTLLQELSIPSGDSPTGHIQKLPYLALARLFLDVLPDISDDSSTLLFDTVGTMWGQLLRGTLATDRFYCSALELIVYAFSSIPDVLTLSLSQQLVTMFQPLTEMTHPFSPRILDRILQSNLWMQNEVLEQCFTRLIETNQARVDERGLPAMSYSVVTKAQILAIQPLQLESTVIWTVRSLTARSLTRRPLDGEEQQLIVKKIKSLVNRFVGGQKQILETEEFSFFYFFCEDVIPLLYVFNDSTALREAFLCVERVLRPNRSFIAQYPVMQRLLECRTFLARKPETHREIGVQALIQLEQGIQVGETDESGVVSVAYGSSHGVQVGGSESSRVDVAVST